ncbi:large conductance mechanosensitive channel protein MscL [Xanthomonas oryzae pv. oryzae]|nr:large conductance mechanosensitive channel protein MscL [Xanthomonas oryzae pv. oryzae]
MVSEFKQFAIRGNVIDLAVGVVIGAAFGKIVTALVEKNHHAADRLGHRQRGFFSRLAWVLKPAGVDATGKDIPAVAIGYGDFINTVVQFVIIAFAIFLLVKLINRVTNRKPDAPKGPSEEVLLLREIRDSLKNDTLKSG